MPITKPSWTDISEAVQAWLETETDLPCFWRDDRHPATYRSGKGICLLHWQQVRRALIPGTDFEFDETASSGSEIVPRQHSLLTLDLQVAVRSWSDAPGDHATILAQQALQRLHLRNRQTTLDAQSISLMTSGPATSLEYTQDGRRFSQATFTLTFSARQVYLDTEDPTGYIDDVEYAINDEIQRNGAPKITTWQLGAGNDTLTYQTNDTGILYWYALPYPSATPTTESIKTNGNSVTVTSTSQGTIDVSSLTDSTLFTIFGVLDAGDLDSSVALTTNITASSAIPANAVTNNNVVVTNLTEVVTYTPGLVTHLGAPVTYNGDNVIVTP